MTGHYKLLTTMVDLKTARENLRQVSNVYFTSSGLVGMCQYTPHIQGVGRHYHYGEGGGGMHYFLCDLPKTTL